MTHYTNLLRLLGRAALEVARSLESNRPARARFWHGEYQAVRRLIDCYERQQPDLPLVSSEAKALIEAWEEELGNGI